MARAQKYSIWDKDRALRELRSELKNFSHDGLVALSEDLGRDSVLRGSWTGCALSYRSGAPGSARRDSWGRARNAFTVVWDFGGLTTEEVRREVEEELARRRVPARETITANV